MKEIKYDGNLQSDVKNNTKTINLYLIIMAIMASSFIPIIVPGINAAIIATMAGGVSFLAIASFFKFKDELDAKRNLNQLATNINREAEIEVSKEKMKSSITKAKEITIKENCYDNGKRFSYEEKIIKYFQFLDREDQIQILKQVQTVIGKEKIDSDLYLLEDEDLEKEGLQYIRK